MSTEGNAISDEAIETADATLREEDNAAASVASIRDESIQTVLNCINEVLTGSALDVTLHSAFREDGLLEISRDNVLVAEVSVERFEHAIPPHGSVDSEELAAFLREAHAAQAELEGVKPRESKVTVVLDVSDTDPRLRVLETTESCAKV